MKFLAAIKQVPARDSAIRVDARGKWIEETDLSFEINEPDAYALEAALLLKERYGGEVIALTAGPARVSQSIREALAKGADRAIHIECDAPNELDTLALARLLAGAIRPEAPDLVLTGLQSDDLGFGQTGVVLAELLGMPHATIVMQVEVNGGAVRVKRELEDGWFQWLEMPMPALLTIQSGISALRYATLLGIKKAKTKPVAVIESGGEAGAEPSAVMQRVYVPVKNRRTEMLDGAPAQVAERLTEILRREVKVL